MTDPTRDLLPEGLEDRLPQKAAAAARTELAAIEKMNSWGYDRVSPPLIEFEASMTERMHGFATRSLFRFVDP
jgi:ATP phosphoribosyltransferase regulatory subunit